MLFHSKKPEWLLIGLGNPGKEYESTRHNVGFRTIDHISRELGIKTQRIRFNAYTERVEICGKSVLLMKPATYMNLSGSSVRLASSYYGISPEQIIVISDDIALPAGRIRIRAGGSAGGHNGLKSIISEIGSQDFPRIRIGVGDRMDPDSDLADWVLGRFTKEEDKQIQTACDNAWGAVQLILSDGPAAAASHYNGLR